MLDRTYRWEIQEYVFRAKESPSLREVITESLRDATFYDSYIVGLGCEPVLVLDESALKSNDAERDRLGLRKGVKGKLLTVAALLSHAQAQPTVCVVVDSDTDGLCGVPPDNVLTTTSTSIETMIFYAADLQVFLARRFAASHYVSGEHLVDLLTPALLWLTACRATLGGLEPGVGLADEWLSHIKVGIDGTLSLDKQQIVGTALRSAGASSKAAVAEELVVAVDEQVREFSRDPATLVRGHDFSAVLLKMFQSKHARNSWNIDLRNVALLDFEGQLRSGLDATLIQDRDPFAGLVTRFGS